jgi:hypothetical protein
VWLAIAIVAPGVPECPWQGFAYFLYEVYGNNGCAYYLDEDRVEEDGNIGEEHCEDSIEGHQCKHPRADFLQGLQTHHTAALLLFINKMICLIKDQFKDD